MGETTTVNVTPTPNVETQEYRDSMVNKIEQANAVPSQPLTTPQQEVKQEKILGKFNSQEDLIKSYQELEKNTGVISKPYRIIRNNFVSKLSEEAQKHDSEIALDNFDMKEIILSGELENLPREVEEFVEKCL